MTESVVSTKHNPVTIVYSGVNPETMTNLQGVAESTIVFLGDSITNKNHRSTTDQAAFAASPNNPDTDDSTNIKTYYNGFAHWANAFLGQRFKVLAYAGVDGDGYKEMRARLQTDVIALSPKYCFLQSGGNGFASLGYTVAAELADMQGIVTELMSAGIIPIVSTMNYNAALTAGAKADKFVDYGIQAQQWLRQQSVIVVDMEKGMGDVTDTDIILHGDYTADGAHPDGAGGAKIGLNIFNDLDKLIPQAYLAPTFKTDYQTGVLNPLQVGTGGTITGTGASGSVADNWTLFIARASTETMVGDKVARTDGVIGSWTEITFSGNAGGVAETMLYLSDDVTNTNSGFVTGDVVALYVELMVTTALVNMILPTFGATWDSNNTDETQMANTGVVGSSDAQALNQPFIMRTPATTLGTETGTDNVAVRLGFDGLSAAAISGVIMIGRVWIGKV